MTVQRGVYTCTHCGFDVPADAHGVAIMKEHLREHDAEEDPES